MIRPPLQSSEDGGEQKVTVTAALRTTRVASLTSPLTVTVSVEQGSRYSVSGDMEIKIGSGETMDSTELTFTPVNDELYSDPLTIDVAGSTSNYNILGTLVMLNDNELQPMKASLSVDNANIAEDGGPATVVVTGRIIQGDAYADKEAKIALGGLGDVEDSLCSYWREIDHDSELDPRRAARHLRSRPLTMKPMPTTWL